MPMRNNRQISGKTPRPRRAGPSGLPPASSQPKEPLTPANHTPTKWRISMLSRPWVVSSVFVLLLATVAWIAVKPRWETNDDPGMMMLAHGVGLAAEPTPNIVYSNVLWGHLVQAMPSLGHATGYATATAACLLVAAWSLMFALNIRLAGGTGPLIAVLLCVICLIRAFTVWQFTVTAGLVMVSGVAVALVALREPSAARRLTLLSVACLLAMLSSLIRLEAAALVVLVAFPLFVSREYLRRPETLMAGGIVLSFVLATYLYSRATYGGEEWDTFRAFEPVRWAITDFQAGAQLRAAPEVMARHGVFPDELALLERWGFLSPELTDPMRWAPALDELGATEYREGAWAGARAGLQALARPGLLWLAACAVCLALMRPSWRILVCWAIFVGTICLLGVLGRPGVERVYVAPLVTLAISPLFSPLGGVKDESPRWRAMGSVLLLALIAILYVPDMLTRARANDASFRAYARAIASVGDEDIVAWGFRFPYQLAYPPLGPIPSMDTKHLALGGFTYVPYAYTATEERAGRGVLDRMRSPEGVLVAADDFELNLLNRYLGRRSGEFAASETIVDMPGLKLSRWKVRPISGAETRR